MLECLHDAGAAVFELGSREALNRKGQQSTLHVRFITKSTGAEKRRAQQRETPETDVHPLRARH